MPPKQPQQNPNTQVEVTPSTPAQVVNPGQPAVGTVNPAGNQPKKNKTKLAILIGSLLVLVLILALVFLYIIPNQPSSIWKKSLNNTAKGYDELVDYVQETEQKRGKISGKFKLDSKDTVMDGNITGRYDENDTELKLDAGAAGQRFNLDLLTHANDPNTNPDIYLRVNGLAGIDKLLASGSPEVAGLGQQLAALDNQWFFIDHTLLDQAESQADEDSKSAAVNKEEFVNFAKKLGDINRQYVFTTDSSKAVFVVKENAGKETLDGRSTYHFKVGINKDNLKAYNKAACDQFLQDDFYKKMAGAFSMGMSEEELKKECYDTAGVDKMDESKTADVWVDLKTKTIRKIRFTDKDNQKNYFDIGLEYDGGDEYPFVFGFNGGSEGGEASGIFKITINTKTNKMSFDIDIDGKDNAETFKFTLNVSLEPGDESFEITKPEGAKSFMELIGGFLGGALGAAGGDPAQNALLLSCSNELEAYSNSGGTTQLSAECQALFGGQ